MAKGARARGILETRLTHSHANARYTQMVDQTADPVLVAVGYAHQITVYAERYLAGDMTRAALIDAMRPAVDMLTCVLPAIPLGPETLEPRKRLAGADARVPKGTAAGR